MMGSARARPFAVLPFTQIAATSGGEDNVVDVIYALDVTGQVWSNTSVRGGWTGWKLIPNDLAPSQPEGPK